MKIAFIVNRFPILSQTFILNQITGLIDLGHDVEIFARGISGEEKEHPDVKKYGLIQRTHYFYRDIMPRRKSERILKSIYIFIGTGRKYPLQILRSLNVFKYGIKAISLYLLYSTNFFLSKKFDLIHCHFGPNGIFGSQLKEIGIMGKLVTTFHGYDMSSVISLRGNRVYKKIFYYSDLCLPISDRWKLKLIRMGCDKKKIAVHRMGINLQKFRYSEKKIQHGEPVRILSIGRLSEKKGLEYAIRAIAKVAAKYHNIEYIIAGDGPLRSKLEKLVTELKIKKYVVFWGEIDQTQAVSLYQRAHIFVLPSITADNGDQEGIPVVLMEAQAAGLPVISTHHSGIPEIVSDGKSGFLVPEKDVTSLIEKLEYLIEHPEIWPIMGWQGLNIVENKYNVAILIMQLEGIYKGLVKHEIVHES